MLSLTRYVPVLAFLLVLPAPVALAHHGDVTHGVLPHSVSAEPGGIVPVNVGTPHPYAFGTTYAFDVHVADARNISVHFERFDVNGFIAPWSGACSGSELFIVDGHTDAVLDAFCGTPASDFWTPAYETDHLVLRFVTDGWYGEHYGFDVYEVAVNGATPVATVPTDLAPEASVSPDVDAHADPFAPAAGVTVDADADATAGEDRVEAGTLVHAGNWEQCGFAGCAEETGAGVNAGTTARVAGGLVDAHAVAYALRTGEGPLDWWLPVPLVSCHVHEAVTDTGMPCPRLL